MDLFAPGDLVFTTWNDGGFRLVCGTSIAAPQVAAAYALYRAAWPDATAAELKQALLDDVDPVPAFAGKSVTGGRLSIGSLADGALGAVRYTFTSMTAPGRRRRSPASPRPGTTPAGDYSVALGLGMEQGGEVWALSGKDLTLGGTTLTTDDSGEALLAIRSRRAGKQGIFGGFSADSLCGRLQDMGCEVLITQDEAWRRGTTVPLKRSPTRRWTTHPP